MRLARLPKATPHTMTAVRTLPKVDIEYLRPLLAGIAVFNWGPDFIRADRR
jgi:hypothetical protein